MRTIRFTAWRAGFHQAQCNRLLRLLEGACKCKTATTRQFDEEYEVWNMANKTTSLLRIYGVQHCHVKSLMHACLSDWRFLFCQQIAHNSVRVFEVKRAPTPGLINIHIYGNAHRSAYGVLHISMERMTLAEWSKTWIIWTESPTPWRLSELAMAAPVKGIFRMLSFMSHMLLLSLLSLLYSTSQCNRLLRLLRLLDGACKTSTSGVWKWTFLHFVAILYQVLSPTVKSAVFLDVP